jgi:hypothetical protein
MNLVEYLQQFFHKPHTASAQRAVAVVRSTKKVTKSLDKASKELEDLIYTLKSDPNTKERFTNGYHPEEDK